MAALRAAGSWTPASSRSWWPRPSRSVTATATAIRLAQLPMFAPLEGAPFDMAAKIAVAAELADVAQGEDIAAADVDESEDRLRSITTEPRSRLRLSESARAPSRGTRL